MRIYIIILRKLSQVKNTKGPSIIQRWKAYSWSEGDYLEYRLDWEEDSERHVEVAKSVRVDLVWTIGVVRGVKLFHTQTFTFYTQHDDANNASETRQSAYYN